MLDIQAGTNEAVIFFKSDLVDKEILYPEFEAVLDGFIGLPDYANRVVKAAFLQISPRLTIQAAVFFTVPFTEDGQVDPTWNIPLQHLADHGLEGPDLGDGKIRLACRSVCPVAWYKEQLWNPDMQGSMTTFDLLVSAVKRNKLGLVAQRTARRSSQSQPPVTSAPAFNASNSNNSPDLQQPRFNRKYRRRLEGLRKQFLLEQKAQAERARRQREKLEAGYVGRLAEGDRVVQELKQRLAKSRRRELKMKEALDKYESQFNKIRDRYEESLKRGSSEYAAEVAVLREQFATDLQEKLNAQADDLGERIAMRESELHYRDQQIAKLREELAQAKKEIGSLMKNDSGQVLQRMTDSGITFVAFHPGIEHLVLPPAEITAYLNNPTAFVADRCGVSEERYREWLMHYRLPVCRHKAESGQVCAEPIDKVLKPFYFRPGESDCCPLHRKVMEVDDAEGSLTDKTPLPR
ncbi:putative coiled-coil protein SlyX [Litorivivens lipolytica]|uniref:Putative coiled-coil protein SlyX n=1 Tax=Litorivivens lipolytica TaxID=1524264 RepID=A0A7W4Z4E6_9GAMM|nr:hypothetical protein [Litorivivens lipolytica]MBB3046023.1 putative coiled-coil protein SlyX [Litorivivens lipolytica]